MLFAGLLAGWYDLRGIATQWMPMGTQIDLRLATFGTVLLGAGSVTMGIAQVAAARRERRIARAMLVLTLFCALGFIYTALRDWSLANFQVSSSAYGTLF
jgi:heme/copper-type cytochrome/quinol oxidase subunit 3